MLTEQAGQKLAEKGRDLATDLRRDAAAAKAAAAEAVDDAGAAAEKVATEAKDAVSDVAEHGRRADGLERRLTS